MKEYTVPKDLLPEWGPYSKKYMGVSRVVGETSVGGESCAYSGVRFDCVVHPAEANMNQPPPNVTFPSAWHMWEAAPDLSFYAYRVELEWKDRLYADVSFSRADDHTVLVRTEFVNDTDLDRNCVLNYYFSMEYPRKKFVECVGVGTIKKFTEYDAMAYNTPRPWEHLMPNGLHRGEFFDASFTDGRGFGERAPMPVYVPRTLFGEEAGDTVTLSLLADEAYDTLSIRYRTTSCADGRFELTAASRGGEFKTDLTLRASDSLTLLTLAADIPAGEVTLTLTSLGGGGVELDFAALSHGGAVTIETRAPEFLPTVDRIGDGYTMRYGGVDETFGFLPLGARTSIRTRGIASGALEDAIPSRLSQADPSFDRVLRSFTSSFSDKHSDEGFYQNFIVHSIFIPANSRHVEFALVGDGAMSSVSEAEAVTIYETARRALRPPRLYGRGERYEFSCRLLQTALLTNVVYPIYRHGEWIKHHTPGKRWDSLYTWDSGFIGLGLVNTERRLSEYILDLYLSDESNADFAFLLHGSPVPVQAYLYLELLNKSRDKSALYERYSRVRRYYRYLAGKAEGSVTDPFKSGLTTTFSYFYNCSGMDDLPPQVAMHAQGMDFRCAPVLTTSQLIRMAKILRMVAVETGREDDVREYDEDIARRSAALLRYAWDEESGYFGYVVHDEDGEPIGIFRSGDGGGENDGENDGENLSKGMDGVYPLVAGICTREQEKRLLAHIFSEKEMFSRVGVSAVDMSAGYYVPDGYWNGNVWFSHQWFLWKTMLDLGNGDGAALIAERALDAWKREVDHSYFTFEMLNIATGRGGWFHHFGGLSSPILIWAEAYFRPGNLSCGFDMWIAEQSFDGASNEITAVVTNYGERAGLLLAVLPSASDVRVTLNGKDLPFVRRDSSIEISIPAGTTRGVVRIVGE